VELKARFDEERNIAWARDLENAGVIVIYGLARLKVHAKLSMVIRREGGGLRRYVHMATGNYNYKTAKVYEDIGLFTAREAIAYDAGAIFNMLTGYSVIRSLRRLVLAPVSLKERVLALIHRETERSSAEVPGRIMAKMNALADPDVIEALYQASAAGVRIDLCIRGVCMLIPGLPGVSENIQVRSVIGNYLEHSRILFFANGGRHEYYLSSADWMPRNLERRVELLFPVIDETLQHTIEEILHTYFAPEAWCWHMQSNGTWTRPEPGEQTEEHSPQAVFRRAADDADTGSEWESGSSFAVRRASNPA
jgi:polyphosphate kinase